jgi:colanic acid biosynthesis glycosyl transferase WcaI
MRSLADRNSEASAQRANRESHDIVSRPLKICFICSVFPPEPEPSGVMALQLGQELARDGHRVTMIVPFPNRPKGRIYPGYRRTFRHLEESNGLRIIRCPNWLIGLKRHVWNRLLENVTFGFFSTLNAVREPRPDVLVLETWPLFAVQASKWLARWWRIPFLYYVKDVYPEAAEKTGLIRNNGLVARFCRFWDRRFCISSAKVIVISESMRDLMAHSRGLSSDRFAVIPDWIDPDEFVPQPIDNTWRREQNIPKGAFVAMFGGSLGHVSGVEILVEVARLLRERRDILIVCIGEGVRKRQMIEHCRSLGLENIRFLPFQPRGRLAEVQGAANVTVLTMCPGYSDASVPSKLISYFAAGRPVVCAAPSGSAVSQIVSLSGAGVVVEPGDATALARAISDLFLCAAKTEQMGRAARAYFERHFTLDRAHRQFSAVLQESTQN